MASARDAIDVVLRDRGLRRSTPEHTAQSLLLGAAASARLEGDDVAPDLLATGGGGPTARAAVRLSTQLLGLVPTWSRTPVQVLARLHSLAAAGSEPDASLGRPADPRGAERLAALPARLALDPALPALTAAALVHGEVLAARAFATHNGVVARAAERLVLVARGVDPASVIVPEAGHAASPHEYAEAVEGYLVGTESGTHQWLLYAAAAFARGAEASPLPISGRLSSDRAVD